MAVTFFSNQSWVISAAEENRPLPATSPYGRQAGPGGHRQGGQLEARGPNREQREELSCERGHSTTTPNTRERVMASENRRGDRVRAGLLKRKGGGSPTIPTGADTSNRRNSPFRASPAQDGGASHEQRDDVGRRTARRHSLNLAPHAPSVLTPSLPRPRPGSRSCRQWRPRLPRKR